MKILCDENVHGPVVDRLRAHGHNVLWIREFTPGITNGHVFQVTRQKDRLLLTGDKDFARSVIVGNEQVKGLVLLRLDKLSPQEEARIVADVIKQRGEEKLNGFVTTIRPTTVREHLLPSRDT